MGVKTAYGEIWDAFNATLVEEVRMIGSLPVIRVVHDGVFETPSTFFMVIKFQGCRIDIPFIHASTNAINHMEVSGEECLRTGKKAVANCFCVRLSFFARIMTYLHFFTHGFEFIQMLFK